MCCLFCLLCSTVFQREFLLILSERSLANSLCNTFQLSFNDSRIKGKYSVIWNILQSSNKVFIGLAPFILGFKTKRRDRHLKLGLLRNLVFIFPPKAPQSVCHSYCTANQPWWSCFWHLLDSSSERHKLAWNLVQKD